MAVPRPWVTPEIVKTYSEHKEVQERDSEKLKYDITRAEQKVINITHNRFDSDKYTELPGEVKLAVILLTEAYAKNAVEATKKKIKSETFDDYSYTAEASTIDITNLGLEDLLEDFIIPVGTGKVVMNLRKL